MGFVMGAIAAFISGMAVFLGRGAGLDPVLVLALQFVFWTIGLMPVMQGGHRAFKTGVNTDLVAYSLVLGLYLSASVAWSGQA